MLGLCCSSHGLLLKSSITNWDIVSKHPAWCHRSTQCILGHSGAVFTLFLTNTRSELMPDARKWMESASISMWWSREKGCGKMWQSSMSRCHIWTSLWSTSFVCEVCPWSLVSIFEDKWVKHLLLEVETFVIISLLCLTAICLWVFKKKLQLPWIFPQRKLKYETLQLFLSYSLYPSTPSSSSCCLCCKHLFFLKELFNILGSVLFHFLELDEKIIAFLMCAC